MELQRIARLLVMIQIPPDIPIAQQMEALESIRRDLRRAANPKKALILQRFFKTGPGEYGEGDVFLGVMVPQSRKIAKTHAKAADLSAIRELLASNVHEERLVALLILVLKYESGGKDDLAAFYLDNLSRVNNWDLVDLTSPNILGAHLANSDRSLLYSLARSANLWERRIAIVATLHFIRMNDFTDTFKIAKMLLGDDRDLIHKAAGWMLREVGKKDPSALEKFLKSNSTKMPRTMLRYAIEGFPEKKRKFYLGSRERR